MLNVPGTLGNIKELDEISSGTSTEEPAYLRMVL
jgi:hypothetical protein